MEIPQACTIGMDAVCRKISVFPLLMHWKYIGLALPYRGGISGSYYCGYMVAVITPEFHNCLEIQIYFNAWHFMVPMAVIMIHT